MKLLSSLTPREHEVLVTYAEQGSIQRVAWALHISKSTVSHHMEHVYTKLDVGCALDAYRALGWLRVPRSSARSVGRKQ